jgi:hypothetical protein
MEAVARLFLVVLGNENVCMPFLIWKKEYFRNTPVFVVFKTRCSVVNVDGMEDKEFCSIAFFRKDWPKINFFMM